MWQSWHDCGGRPVVAEVAEHPFGVGRLLDDDLRLLRPVRTYGLSPSNTGSTTLWQLPQIFDERISGYSTGLTPIV